MCCRVYLLQCFFAEMFILFVEFFLLFAEMFMLCYSFLFLLFVAAFLVICRITFFCLHTFLSCKFAVKLSLSWSPGCLWLCRRSDLQISVTVPDGGFSCRRWSWSGVVLNFRLSSRSETFCSSRSDVGLNTEPPPPDLTPLPSALQMDSLADDHQRRLGHLNRRVRQLRRSMSDADQLTAEQLRALNYRMELLQTQVLTLHHSRDPVLTS